MRIAIHQPQYFPYAGFFHKLSLADAFIIMDDVQYDKRFTNRNRIISPNGWIWLTVPINKEHKFRPNFEVEINNDIPWRETHWKNIHHMYANAKFFHLYENYFKTLYQKEWKMLFDLDLETIKQTIKFLGLKTEIILESELKVDGESTQRLVNVCKSVGANTYVSGAGGRDYIDSRLFEKNNIKLVYQNYMHEAYAQHLSQSFVPDLSIIDTLANLGPDTLQLIVNQNKCTITA